MDTQDNTTVSGRQLTCGDQTQMRWVANVAHKSTRPRRKQQAPAHNNQGPTAKLTVMPLAFRVGKLGEVSTATCALPSSAIKVSTVMALPFVSFL